ncbi:radical SAM protein, partial [Candidatus Gracilibacteria bacterium]|nr:radical SAM protein [Candidatus Gracilibacteria bacterium]
AYGCDNTKNFKNTKFQDLLQIILEKTTIPRIRISSIGIEYINKELLKIFKNTRINPHFHLSIQSGSDKILKSMNRNYSREILLEVLKNLNNLKRDDKILVSIGADIIVGFPGEDESDFMKSFELIKKFNITKVHGFKFSPHKNHYTVPAGNFPNQVSESLKTQRLKKLLKEAEKIRTNFIEQNKGKNLNILIEKIKGKSFNGWSENYISLNETNFEPLSGEKIKVGKIANGKFL